MKILLCIVTGIVHEIPGGFVNLKIYRPFYMLCLFCAVSIILFISPTTRLFFHTRLEISNSFLVRIWHLFRAFFSLLLLLAMLYDHALYS